jgi:hypothetical protein
MTWFRHQIVPDLILDQQISEALLRQLRDFIKRFRLTGSA